MALISKPWICIQKKIVPWIMYQFSPNHHFPSVDHHFLPENGPETGQNPWISLEITARRWREPPSNWTWSPTAQYLSGKHLAAAAFFLRRKDDCWVVILGFTYFFWVVGCYRVIIYIYVLQLLLTACFFFFRHKMTVAVFWTRRNSPRPSVPVKRPVRAGTDWTEQHATRDEIYETSRCHFRHL